MTRALQRFEVAVKGFVVREGRLLLLEQTDGTWELPGGRFEVGEERSPATDVLARELAEELGADVRVGIGPPLATRTRERADAFVFVVAFRCDFRGGEIRLSPEHRSYEWVDSSRWRDRPLDVGYERALAGFWAAGDGPLRPSIEGV